MSFGGGSNFSSFTAKTFTLAPSAVGDIVLVQVICETAADYASAISSSNVTWDSSPALPHTTVGGTEVTTIFKGEVTSTSSATVTITTAAGSPVIRGFWTEVSTTAGYANVAVDTTGTVAQTGTAPPSLTPGHGAGECYWGFQFNTGTGTAGSTSGYTYEADANGNVAMWNTSCTSGTQSPTIGGGGNLGGGAVLLYETSTSVTGTGSAGLASMGAHGSGLVANAVSGSGSAHLSSMGATGTGTVTVPLPGYPDEPLDAKTELLLGGTWTDITQWAMPESRQYGQIKNGQPDGSQQLQPASMAGTWDNGDARFSIRTTSGPYYGDLKQNIQSRVSFASVWGTYLRLEGTGGDYASTPDNSALHVTGSIDIRAGLMLSDWGPCVFGARYGASGTPSWIWGMLDDGTLQLGWFDSGGTSHSAVSTASVPYQPGETALRVTLNTSTGAVSFYTSTSVGGTWTQLGSTVTGSATSIAAGNQPLTVGYSAYGGTMGQLYGDVYDFQVLNGIGGTLVANAAFSAQTAEATSWTDSAGRTWGVSGAAELSGRDYRLHAELSSLIPTVGTSGGQAKANVTLSGRSRRLQQGNPPPKLSPMTRGLLAQPGSLAPVALWPCEDPGSATQLASAIPGASPVTFVSGTPKLASGTPFGAASQALPAVNGAEWHGPVPSYSGGSAIVVRALVNFADSAPSGSVYWPIMRLVTTGTATWIDVVLSTSGGLNLSLETYNSSIVQLGNSGTVNFSPGGALAGNTNCWVSIEGTVVSGQVEWALVLLVPGASAAEAFSLPLLTGSLGNITDVYVNPTAVAIDSSVVGMISVQKAWESMFSLNAQLQAYAGELAATRFRRVCSEEGIGCRVIGPDAGSAAMGPQPTGSVLQILQDCATADGGIMFEPRSVVGVGLRTKASMVAQPTAVTLSFPAGNLPGSFGGADDDMIICNDLTASDGYGNSVRYTLDDGSNKSISEPPTGTGEYSSTATLNVAAVSQLPGAAAWYVARRSADAGRYKGLTADFGIPGAPAVDIARLRPGDRVVVSSPPDTYQTADITQIQQGATETFGPGRSIAWDCIPSLPWDDA